MMKACTYKAKAILITAYASRRYLSAILAWRRGLLAGLRPVRRSAYSEKAGIRCARPARLHIQRPGMRRTRPAPAYSASAWRFSRGRRRRGMNGQHIQCAPWISRARRRRGMDPRHIHRAPGISRARRRRGMSPRHIQWAPAYSSSARDQSRS